MAPTLGPGDRQDVVALSQAPGERELTGGDALLFRDLLDPADERDVVIEVLVLEPRVLTPPVIGGKVALIVDPSRQEAAAERRVRDVGDVKLPTRRQRLFRRIAIEQRVLALHGAQRMDGMPALDRCGRCFREAKVSDLALVDEA